MRSKFKWILTLLIAVSMQYSFAQEKTITGSVTDVSGSALAGANVQIQGAARKTQTGYDGKFLIKSSVGDVLVFSFIGMQEITRTVGAANTINVKLAGGDIKLAEVVIEGYKTTTKSKSTSATKVISSDQIENRPNANVLSVLQGQMAGVNITSGSGQPGSAPSVLIRGAGSINGNTEPLYVIDGFPTTAENYRSMNPNDFETSTVLKDASALAAYGSRGSNGVLVFTTRKGKVGGAKSQFRYSSNYGITQLQDARYNRSNAKQMLTLQKIRNIAPGSTLTTEQIAAYNIDTNWVGFFFRDGTTSDHNLSFENSAKNVGTFTSLNYLDQNGILDNTGLKRFTFRNNINGKSNDEKFTYMVNTAVGFSKNNESGSLGTGAINRNVVLGAYQGLPFLDPNRYEGSIWTINEFNTTPGLSATPYMIMDRLKTWDRFLQETKIDVATDFGYKINSDFAIKTRVNGSVIDNRVNEYESPDSFNAILFSSTPGVALSEGGNFNGAEFILQRREFYFNNLYQVVYNKNVGKHTFDASANMEYNHSRLTSNNITQRGLNPLLWTPNTGAGWIGDVAANDFFVPTVTASQLRRDLISYFGLFDYDYNNIFGLSASYRTDGTSIVAPVNKFLPTFSFGGRVNFDRMSFMKGTTFNVLKLRASYGSTGNDRVNAGTVFAGINPPLFANSFSQANNVYAGQLGSIIRLGDPNLRWEPTFSANVGVDFALAQNRVRGAVDVYNRKTTELFIDVPVSAVVGAQSIRANSDASLTNSGVEIDLAFDVAKNANFKFTLRMNGSYNKNFAAGIVANNGRIRDGNIITQNNGPINEFFVVPFTGVNPATGNLWFRGADGNNTENPFDTDRVATGKNRIPVYQGGFGYDLEYKGFYSSTLFTFVKDVWRFDFDESSLYNPANISQFVVSEDLLNAWTPTNTNTNVPALGASNLGFTASDRFLRDASYLRMRNLQVGYRFSKNQLKGVFIKSLAFNLQAENLITVTKWRGFDAESNRTGDQVQYPTPKIFTFGIDLKF